VEKSLYPIIAWSERSLPSAVNIMDVLENPESMSGVIEFKLQKPMLVPLRSGVHDGVDRRRSSSLTGSKFERVGVWAGVSTVDDESQSDPSGEKLEVVDEREENDDEAE